MTASGKSRVVGVVLAGGRSRRMGGKEKAFLDLAGKPMLAHVIERLCPQVARLVLNANGDAARFATFGLPVVADAHGANPPHRWDAASEHSRRDSPPPGGEGLRVGGATTEVGIPPLPSPPPQGGRELRRDWVGVENDEGPLAGILAGMRWAASEGATHVATVPTDAPFLPLDLVTRLAAAIEKAPGAIAVATSAARVHHVVGLWPVALADDIAATLEAGARAVVAWLGRHHTAEVAFSMVGVGDREIDPFFNVNTPEDIALARNLLTRAKGKT